MSNPGGTHWETCFRVHPDCAEATIRILEDQATAAQGRAQAARAEVAWREFLCQKCRTVWPRWQLREGVYGALCPDEDCGGSVAQKNMVLRWEAEAARDALAAQVAALREALEETTNALDYILGTPAVGRESDKAIARAKEAREKGRAALQAPAPAASRVRRLEQAYTLVLHMTERECEMPDICGPDEVAACYFCKAREIAALREGEGEEG